MVTINADIGNTGESGLRAAMSDALRTKLHALKSILASTQSLQREQGLSLMDRIREQAIKVDLDRTILSRKFPLAASKIIPVQDIEAAKFQLATDTATLIDLRSQLAQMPDSNEIAIDNLINAIADVRRDIAQNEMLREIVLVAAEDGVVSADLINEGQTATPAQAILIIENPKVEAHLAVPASARGFVRPGDVVNLRHAAYTYTKYGTYQGTVIELSSTALTVAEMEQLQVGAPADGEAVYRLTVKLQQHAVSDDRGAHPLLSGMALTAEIGQETRRIYEFALVPAYILHHAAPLKLQP